METFWSVRANKVMEIVPMEATEKGVERGRERGKESQRLILTMLSASLPVCSRLFLPLLARYTFGRGEEEKRRDSEKLEMRRKKGEEEALALGWWVLEFVCRGRTIHFRVAVLDPSMRHDSFYFGPAAHRISLMMTVRQSGGGKKRRGEEMRRGRGECNPNGCRRKPTANVAAVFFALMARS